MVEGNGTKSSVFDRLYSTPTHASDAKRKSAGQTPGTRGGHSQATPHASIEKKKHTTSARTTDRRRSNPAERDRRRPNPTDRRRSNPTDRRCSNPKSSDHKAPAPQAPPEPLQPAENKYLPSTKVLISSKRHPKTGYARVDISVLRLSDTLRDYEAGELSQTKVASEIIEAFFRRDFIPGTHWDIDPTVVNELEDGVLFNVSKEATWDWKDIYSVASAKATIRFLPNQHEIRVEEYIYSVAG
mmetsp:Transcript_18114/g.41900  ORF Transcript_18114/g.41900 Transcript_18114/m.41900 type:complete len:242 (-) Transcript_18114:92-817(-)